MAQTTTDAECQQANANDVADLTEECDYDTKVSFVIIIYCPMFVCHIVFFC